MPPRNELIDGFLRQAGWSNAVRTPLAGDASNRRYERLTRGIDPAKQTAVLMDADPAKGEDVAPFIAIAEHLRLNGLSAPCILARDVDHGLLLLEDLGDALFAGVTAADPAVAEPLYAAATDMLVALHRVALPDRIAPYDAAEMGRLAALAAVWYRRGVTGRPSDDDAAHLEQEVRALCEAHCHGPSVLVLRDFHAENLIWLPHRDGIARVGLLDFQDAMAGHPAYDLVSLLGDARRDVDAGLADAMLSRYITATGDDPVEFRRAAATLSAQRNLRILGVFARLCLRDGKAHYVDYIPRVWSVLQRDLQHPDLELLRNSVAARLPMPTPEILRKLKEQCATVP